MNARGGDIIKVVMQLFVDGMIIMKNHHFYSYLVHFQVFEDKYLTKINCNLIFENFDVNFKGFWNNHQIIFDCL